MTNLTEQNLSKKNGKTFFYIKFPNGEVIQGDEFALGLYRMCNDGDKVEMLEQVPSYEQWQAKLNENTQLKELLKECREEIEKHIPKKWHGEKDETMQKYRNKRELRTKIDEVLK